MAWRSCHCGAFVLLQAHHCHDPDFTSVLVQFSKRIPAFDITTNAVVAIVPVGTSPAGDAVSPAGTPPVCNGSSARGYATLSRLTLP